MNEFTGLLINTCIYICYIHHIILFVGWCVYTSKQIPYMLLLHVMKQREVEFYFKQDTDIIVLIFRDIFFEAHC